MFQSSYVGSGNFSAELLDADSGAYVTLAANEVGTKNSSRYHGVSAGSYVLSIKASGTWRITVQQPRYTSGASLPHTFSGTGTTATGAFQVTRQGLIQFHGTHDGTSNFSGEVLDGLTGEYITLAVNEVGRADSTRAYGLKPGVYVFGVLADGNWSIAVSG